jgi:hypothetical protein
MADGVIEYHQRLCRSLCRAREEQAKMNAKHRENEKPGMTHEIFKLNFL